MAIAGFLSPTCLSHTAFSDPFYVYYAAVKPTTISQD